MLSGEKVYNQMRKSSCLAKPKDTVATVKQGGGSIMLWDCCAASGSGEVHKID